MKSLFKEKTEKYIILFISFAVAVSSQLYINAFADSFRISIAVILLPLLIMFIGEDTSTVKICFSTAVMVFAVRATIHFIYSGSYRGTLQLYYPNAVFYIAYGLIFAILCQNKHTISYSRLYTVLLTSDFLANICEICITHSHTGFGKISGIILTLAAVALVRSTVAWCILAAERQYTALLKREEHEKRYQRLFLMTTGLKNEIYFMKKNSEEIERVMGTAYKLYENLSDTNLAPEIKNMSLALAKDVHEIKKDYIRIIKGIENEISEDYDEKQMKFSDLLRILKDTTYQLLESKNITINLVFRCSDDFATHEHYELMNIFKNLVTNAIEAIEGGEKGDTITLEQALVEGEFIFVVKDNGPGISKRHLPNIFKMGYSTKFDYVTGNIYRGVGLCGVKATIEEQFGGSIEVDSVFGEGTQFTIKIPSEAISFSEENNKL
ncbi:MAG: sensor histidine kinase [Oscillospiraceae bacterium]|nr:sensor histidine kinase [Oscillospiraceae bacterium]